MENRLVLDNEKWLVWQKLLFRFFCIYILLYTTPWLWISEIPFLSFMEEYYERILTWLIVQTNSLLFHIPVVKQLPNGSGDTSFHYATLRFMLVAATLGTLVWTVFDKRNNYNLAYYWLIIVVRYYVAMHAIFYGIIKLFALQMIFPPLSALATPLGDLLPMRLSWYFIGYSTPYQVFSGAVEFIAGLLLLFRRTSTLGAFMAASVFLNVVAMNLCYDIPVKLFSIHLFLLSNFLLIADAKRLINFFILNKPTEPTKSKLIVSKWVWIGQIALKTGFFILFVIMPIYQFTTANDQKKAASKLTTGVFAVEDFSSTLPDSLRWKDVIFEADDAGSVQTTDTLFRQRYRRGYFRYTFDTLKHTIAFKKLATDTLPLFTMQYVMPDTNRLILNGKIRNDSIRVILKREPRHFQLTERQFHWISEANR